MSQHEPTGDDPNAINPSDSGPTPDAPDTNPWGPPPQAAPPAAEWPGYSGSSGSGSSAYDSSGAGNPTQSPYQAYDPSAVPPYGAPTAPSHSQPGHPTHPYAVPGQQAYGSNPYAVPGQQGYGSNPYEVNPYQPQYGSYVPYGAVAQQHPQATTAMILGIVGLGLCPPVGIGGLIMGNNVRKAIDAEPQRYTGRGMATVGFVLGILSCFTTAVTVLVIILGFGGLLGS